MYGSEMSTQELFPPPIPPFRMYSGHGYLPPPPPPPPLSTPYRYSTAQMKEMYSNPCTPRNVSYGSTRIQRRKEKKLSITTKSMVAAGKSINGPLKKPSNSYVVNHQTSVAATAVATNPADTIISPVTTVTNNNGGNAVTTNTTTMASCDQNATEELKIPPQWLKRDTCELCKVKLNGDLQADAHYEGKNHAKKARQYLEQLWQARGNKSPLPASVIKEMKEKKSPPLTEMYCKLCDVAFTSDIQANQHHNGRNHQRRLRGEPPLPKGFYNPITKTWQRQPPGGMPYIPKENREQKKIQPRFYCSTCSVSLTSQIQLDSHMAGSRHKIKESSNLKANQDHSES